MSAPPRQAPYGCWRSPISAALAASAGIRIGAAVVDGPDVYWIEGRPAEGGRYALVRRDAHAVVTDITPRAFNVRTRVHEYGGGGFAVSDGQVAFVHDGDQRLYLQDPGGTPRALTAPGALRYADLVFDRPRNRLLCVVEDHRRSGVEPENFLGAVDLTTGALSRLIGGADFYAFPRLSPQGDRLAYLSWHHPHMPWEVTELWVAPVRDDGRLGLPERVAGGRDESVYQPAWSPGGVLHFVSDRCGWWNLYRRTGDRTEPLCPRAAEFGYPLWVFGLSNYAFVDEGVIACAHQQGGTWALSFLERGELRTVEGPLSEISHLNAAGGRAVFVGASPATGAAIYAADPRRRTVELLHRPSPLAVDAGIVAHPCALSFPTTDGAVAHALYYPPTNPEFKAPAGERPPLLVLSHGGPTAAASTALSLSLQFWTSRGFAVLDVNYRGSTGYGRAYRRALEGAWGIADVDDCVAGAQYLVAQGLADGARLAIRGGSAGGYTTLAALTFRDLFKAGASHYGVSDLEALARDTHKFESRYLDSMIGPYPERRDLYVARSPINFVDRLDCPVIFLQGLQDRVVPPAQAERMVEALRTKGIPVEYVTFPDEQHGFRRAENIVRALEAELAFYARVFALPAAA